MESKPLDNTNIEEAKAKTSDLQVYGNGDTWVLICKASSTNQGWMKSTKALEVSKIGCLVQVTSEFCDASGHVISCAEAVTFVPCVKIGMDDKGNPKLTHLEVF